MKGFTLIELLVVVLIIGILAAIALPQYKKAVERTYTAEVQQNVANLEKAIDVYLMENGGYPSSTVQFFGTDTNGSGLLNIDITQGMDCNAYTCSTKHFFYSSAYCGSGGCTVFIVRPRNGNSGTRYQIWTYKNPNTQNRWHRQCEYEDDYEYICRGMEAQGYERIACC